MEQGSTTRLTEKIEWPRKRGSVFPEESRSLSNLSKWLETVTNKKDKLEIRNLIKNLESQIQLDNYNEAILHIVVCHGDTKLVDSLLNPLSEETQIQRLHTRVADKAFNNNVMGAELPLSVATLTGNKIMVEYLLRRGARPTEKNSRGENVLHSIIFYAYLYPEKADLMLEMVTFYLDTSTAMKELIQKKPDENIHWRMLLTTNNRGNNPLQVAIQLGQLEIFKYIFQTAYRYELNSLFSIERYDMTDVDMSLTLFPETSNERLKVLQDTYPLDHLFSIDIKTAMAFLNYRPLSRLIRERWIGYRKLFWLTFFFHSVIMIMLTVTAVIRAERKPIGGVITDVNEINNATDVLPSHVFSIPAKGVSEQFVIATGFISFFVAILCIVQEIWRLYKGRLCLQIKNLFHPFSNNMFRLQIFIFGLSLIADFLATWFSVYGEDFALLLAIIIGWFLFLFFFRAMRRFCQFTSLAQRAMFDIIRFSVIIFIELVAFTTVMYALIRGSKLDANDDGREFQETWIKALFLVFQQIFGIGDLPLSNIRNRVIVNLVYICFIVTTTVLMLNALIAIMSNTCTQLFNSNDVTAHLRFHQYSIIRFFESILSDRYVMRKARTNLKEVDDQKSPHQKRFVLNIKSLRSFSNEYRQHNSLESINSQQTSSTNVMTRKPLESDSIEIHHLCMGLCDKCHIKYALPKTEMNKTYDIKVKCKF
ncbi:hypothetical protein ACJMK2_038269 [Sinanodonta woodiana]|uniref:Ion transport domain-containing protein n=1 Tax=Sinanodonta woodiana TaxID=1069815 RepID=A0ABD3WBL1_SINWO